MELFAGRLVEHRERNWLFARCFGNGLACDAVRAGAALCFGNCVDDSDVDRKWADAGFLQKSRVSPLAINIRVVNTIPKA